MKQKLYVVEGTHDEALLKQIDANMHTISVGGSEVKKDVLEFLKNYEDKFQIILLFDPDYTGEAIRKKVASHLSNPGHIFIPKNIAYSKNKKKIGVEHLSLNNLRLALNDHIKETSINKTITLEALYKLGLSGQKDAQIKRDYLTKALKLGHCNTKTLIDRLNWIGISYKEIEDILHAST